MKALLLLLLCSLAALGQTTYVAPAPAGGVNGSTTSAVDTTGAKVIVWAVTYSTSQPAPAMSDSAGNTWTCLSTYTASPSPAAKLCYVLDPATSASHTFTLAQTNCFCIGAPLAVIPPGWVSYTFDTASGATDNVSSSTLSTGSVTPAEDGSLLVSALAINASTSTPTIASGFTSPAPVFANLSSGVHNSMAVSYREQATAAAINPAWSYNNATTRAMALLAVFTAAGEPPPVDPELPAEACEGNTIFRLDADATSIALVNSGPLGGAFAPLRFPGLGSGQHVEMYCSKAGYGWDDAEGVATDCPDPCAIAVDLELGRTAYQYEIHDASHNVIGVRSAKHYMPFVPQSRGTAPFAVPFGVHGFKDFWKGFSYTAPSGDLSGARIWAQIANARNDTIDIRGGTPASPQDWVRLKGNPIVSCAASGSAVTFGTLYPHGFVPGAIAYLSGMPGGDFMGALEGAQTVATAPTATTFAVASSKAADADCNEFGGRSGSKGNAGKSASRLWSYGTESHFAAGFHALEGSDMLGFLVPVTVAPGVANVIDFRFNPSSYGEDFHGYWPLSFNVILSDVELTEIVVSGSTATAACATSCGFTVGQTVLLRDTPSYRWRFDGLREITATPDATHFSFAWGPDSGAGEAPYTTPEGTYTVPTMRANRVGISGPQPKMYAARALIPKSAFDYAAPEPPAPTGDAMEGVSTFLTGVLKTHNEYVEHRSLASCASCHESGGLPGADLKRFGFHLYPESIKVAALARGRTEADAANIIAAVNALDIDAPATARPWNPPFQPCPGLDAQPVANWIAGCGLWWIKNYDDSEDLVPGGDFSAWDMDQDVNFREIPVSIAMPTWPRWLPQFAPEDFFYFFAGGQDWESQTPYGAFVAAASALSPGNYSAYSAQAFLNGFPSGLQQSARSLRSSYEPAVSAAAVQPWPGRYWQALNGITQWANVHTFGLIAQNELAEVYDDIIQDVRCTANARTAPQYPRGFYTYLPFRVAGHINHDSQVYFQARHDRGRTSVGWDQDAMSWYWLQILLAAGNRCSSSDDVIDTNYFTSFNQDTMGRRPAFWMAAAITPYTTQQQFGWDELRTESAWMDVQGLVSNILLYFAENDGLATEAEKQSYIEAVIDQLHKAIVEFGAMDWAELVTFRTQTTVSATVSCSNVTGVGRWGDMASLLLTLGNHYGVDSGTLDAIETWAETVWPGHDFGADRARTLVTGQTTETTFACL